MIEVHAEFPQREVIQANAVVDNEEKTVSEVIISAKPEITGVTASVDNETGTPYVDVTETGTGTDFSFNLAFHNLKGDKGEQGETGQTGNGIVSITKTATVGLEDDYTISFTNGTQTVFTVTNGADGQDGTDGTDGQDGQDGFSPIATVEPIQDGAKITITDKDGTTTTNVYNGTDGQDGADGQAATVTVGTTATGAAGTNASVVNSGTSSAAVFDFVIPRGDKGDTGNTGATGNGIINTEYVSSSGLVDTYHVNYTNGDYDTFTVTNGRDGSGSVSDVQINGTSITSGGVANIVTNTAYNASSNKIATMSDLPSGGANTDLSNLTATGEAHFQEPLVSGTNIKTINSTSLLGSGNIAVQSVISDLAEIRLNASDGARIYSQISNAGDIITGSQSLKVQMFDGSSATNYQLLDGTTGLIPDARISANIARTSQIPSISGLANTSLSNLSSAGKKVIDSAITINQQYVTPSTSAGKKTIDIASYLPNDNYTYLVLTRMYVNNNSTFSGITVATDLVTMTNFCGAGANGRYAQNSDWLPVGSGRTMTVTIGSAIGTTLQLEFIGYRRVGTNS